MPDDTELYDLNHMRADIEKDFKYPTEFEDEAHYKSEHFGEITIEFLFCFSFIMDKAIKYKKQEILVKCTEELNKLNSDIERYGRKQKYQEAFLYLKSSEMISSFAFKAFKEDIYTRGSDARGLLPTLFSHDIEQGKLYSRGVLQKYCYLLIDLQGLDKLDRWFLGGLDFGIFISEGDLGELARRCVVNYKKNITVQNCLLDIIETYKILKGNYEVGKVKRFDLYTAVKVRLETIVELMVKHKIDNEELINSTKDFVSGFKSQEEYESLN
ncbi:MAG: hypothetical protein M0D53_12385 [Flavobacterium sp. JAD_PAG50586_2]|nr:MAG: hypothetical protein M0D53_12385 [Flavobacterium sp. JAD_PAG50586_2]